MTLLNSTGFLLENVEKNRYLSPAVSRQQTKHRLRQQQAHSRWMNQDSPGVVAATYLSIHVLLVVTPLMFWVALGTHFPTKLLRTGHCKWLPASPRCRDFSARMSRRTTTLREAVLSTETRRIRSAMPEKTQSVSSEKRGGGGWSGGCLFMLNATHASRNADSCFGVGRVGVGW